MQEYTVACSTGCPVTLYFCGDDLRLLARDNKVSKLDCRAVEKDVEDVQHVEGLPGLCAACSLKKLEPERNRGIVRGRLAPPLLLFSGL